VGAGGALPNAGALAAEIAPLRWRAIAVKLTIVCVPLGGMLGGLIAARVLPALGWRALYQIGGMLPLAFAAIMFAVLPESPRFLARRSHLWPKLERLLRKMSRGVPAGAHFEEGSEGKTTESVSVRELLSPTYRRDTAGLWLAFLFCLGNIYLVFSWLPALLTSRGLDVATASQWLALYNLGGVLGVLIWAALMTSFGSRAPLIWASLAASVSALAILLVPLYSPTGRDLTMAGIFISGLLANAVQTSMYAVAAHVYPTSIRASGVAYAASVGRVGGLVSSLFGAGLIALGAGAYWGTIALCMVAVFAGLSLVRNHFPAIATRSAGDMLRR
jgi:AAHS family 4-hydroxybenzoate transporter-like MFS transporter